MPAQSTPEGADGRRWTTDAGAGGDEGDARCRCVGARDHCGDAHGEGDDSPSDALERRLRRCGVAVARRELATALDATDDLTPAQRRTLAVMAGRIAGGVLAPAREAVAGGDGEDRTPERETVEELFLGDERVRDGT